MEEQMKKEKKIDAIFSHSLKIIESFLKGLDMCISSNVFKQSERTRLHSIFDIWLKSCDGLSAKLLSMIDKEGDLQKGKEISLDQLYQKAKNNQTAIEQFMQDLTVLYQRRMSEFDNADEISVLFENSNFKA